MADQWRPYDAPGNDSAPPPTPAPYAGGTYPAYDAAGERRRLRRRVGMLVVGALVVLGGAGAGITALVVSALDDDSTTTSTTTTTTTRTEIHSSGSGDVDLYSTAATRAMAEALVKETGSPKVLEVVLFQAHAVLTVPDGGGARSMLWDGTSLTDAGEVASTRPSAFDLGDLDGAVVRDLCGKQPLRCTAVIGRPRPGDNGAWMTIASPSRVHFTDLQGR
ncbi:hypothetical protein QI633_10445 [Nocardioides sp. QY071]|uniref:hypothetical protein n=1 Tax=Nocardioides sp. QY071 TaxID=3044187 RepID=UPI00249A9142|nr:hypothetical protein [Nocardioides sp. QY071]WGY04167.1 hypothetical protein QI633_10445 [Nocardioides sp. QY071]